MFLKLGETGCMGLEILALEGDVAVDTDKGGRSAPSEGVGFGLLLLERGVTVRAHEGNHDVENN